MRKKRTTVFVKTSFFFVDFKNVEKRNNLSAKCQRVFEIHSQQPPRCRVRYIRKFKYYNRSCVYKQASLINKGIFGSVIQCMGRDFLNEISPLPTAGQKYRSATNFVYIYVYTTRQTVSHSE